VATDFVIETNGLTKRYGRRAAVDELSISVPAGVVAGFVGPNGAGKTTTMSILLGLVSPTGGTARVLGEAVSDPSAYLPHVGALIERRPSTRDCPVKRTCGWWPPSPATIRRRSPTFWLSWVFSIVVVTDLAPIRLG
jgi:ABC-type multidrug transport system ATPase subunit